MTVESTDEKCVLTKKPYEVLPVLLPYPLALAFLLYTICEALVNGRGAAELPELLVCCVLMAVLTYAFLRFMYVVTLTVDRPAGVATYRRANLFGATERDIPLAELRRVEVEQGTDSDNDPTYRLILRLSDGEVIPFTKSTYSWLGDKQSAADAVNQFLGVDSPLLPTRV